LNQPFTHDFPRADIYEILTPDLLHQVIKGTFKDHLVTWVGEYLVLEHGEAYGNKILDDIDRRFVYIDFLLFLNLTANNHGQNCSSSSLPKPPSIPTWPSLQTMDRGWCVSGIDIVTSQLTLLQVYVPAIAGHVPSEMTQAIASFLDVCYTVRRANLDRAALRAFDTVLAKFYTLREVFHTSGVRPTGFSLPRQHSLSHYHHLIEEFGAPGGVCSSITESRHITAVKKSWRRSNRYKALGQMLVTNQRLDKLAAARVDFVNRGMLDPTNPQAPGMVSAAVVRGEGGDEVGDEENEDEQPGAGPTGNAQVAMVTGNVTLARTRSMSFSFSLAKCFIDDACSPSLSSFSGGARWTHQSSSTT
jgi:hypothetical protein